MKRTRLGDRLQARGEPVRLDQADVVGRERVDAAVLDRGDQQVDGKQVIEGRDGAQCQHGKPKRERCDRLSFRQQQSQQCDGAGSDVVAPEAPAERV